MSGEQGAVHRPSALPPYCCTAGRRCVGGREPGAAPSPPSQPESLSVETSPAAHSRVDDVCEFRSEDKTEARPQLVREVGLPIEAF